MKYLFLLILIGVIMLANVSCLRDCPDTVVLTIDASKDTIVNSTYCALIAGARANVTIEGYQNDSSGFTIISGPLNKSSLDRYDTDAGAGANLPKDSVWYSSEWMDAFHDTLYVIYRNRNVTKGQLKITVYYYSNKNNELVKKLPK